MLPVRPDELEAAARERLTPAAYAFYASGAGGETSVAESVAAWRRWHVRPRVGIDVSTVSTATTVQGAEVALPVLLAPCGFNALAHPDGELAVARAGASAGTIPVVSTSSSHRLEDIASCCDGRKWFQLYASPEPRATDALVRRAEEAGFRALVLTVDTPVLGVRHVGFADLETLAAQMLETRKEPFIQLSATLDWQEIERIIRATQLPVVLKGVLHPDDAATAADLGVAGLIVSNHGGRQLDGTIPPALALPEVVRAVGPRIEVYADGGVRSGVDVLRALALGARAVLVGRPYLWALTLAGEDGVRELLARFRSELENALALAGQTEASAVDPSMVVPAP